MESANVLASWCGNPVWPPTGGGTSRWLDRVVGRGVAVHLSRTGQTVASLAAVNASGQIAAHGVERATGCAAALLLTPAP